MIDSGPSGFSDLLASLSAIGADSALPLPGVDEPLTAREYMGRALALLKGEDIPFDRAWSSAINRIQAPQGEGGFIEDPVVGELVKQERALLEEVRPFFRASYEGRSVTTRERAVCTLAAWGRFEGTGTGTPKTRS